MEKELHDRDFNLWTEQIATAIRNRDIESMDWDNLLEEIEDMTASQKRALRSYFKRLLEHIFKLKYWESERDRCLNGWRIEVANFRDEIKDILEDSPSLNNYLQQNYRDWYKKSVKKSKYNNNFEVPDHEPISLDKILDDNYFG